jgi:hypothetical protein
MRRSFSSALALAITVLMTTCSSGSGGSSGGGGTTSVFVPGKWTITLFSNSGSLFANTVELDLDLTQSGSAVSSDTTHSIDGASCAGMHVDSSTGSVSGDTIKLVFSIDSEQITMKGKLSPDGKSILSGTFTPGNGSCISGTPINIMGGWTPGLNGSFSGGIQIPDAAPTVTAVLAEDASFDLTGNMNVTGDTCFSVISTAPDNPGISIGDLSAFEMTDGTNMVDFVGRIEQAPGLATEYDANFTVAAGCTEQTGVLTLDVTGDAMSASASRPPKTVAVKINPLLNERMKTVLDARRVQRMESTR